MIDFEIAKNAGQPERQVALRLVNMSKFAGIDDYNPDWARLPNRVLPDAGKSYADHRSDGHYIGVSLEANLRNAARIETNLQRRQKLENLATIARTETRVLRENSLAPKQLIAKFRKDGRRKEMDPSSDYYKRARELLAPIVKLHFSQLESELQ